MCYCHHVIQLAAALSNTDASDIHIALRKNRCMKHTVWSRCRQASSPLLTLWSGPSQDSASNWFCKQAILCVSYYSVCGFWYNIALINIPLNLQNISILPLCGYEVNQWSFKDDLISLSSCHIVATVTEPMPHDGLYFIGIK
jgi:hypothetical protein